MNGFAIAANIGRFVPPAAPLEVAASPSPTRTSEDTSAGPRPYI